MSDQVGVCTIMKNMGISVEVVGPLLNSHYMASRGLGRRSIRNKCMAEYRKGVCKGSFAAQMQTYVENGTVQSYESLIRDSR